MEYINKNWALPIRLNSSRSRRRRRLYAALARSRFSGWPLADKWVGAWAEYANYRRALRANPAPVGLVSVLFAVWAVSIIASAIQT